jgi:myosin heavy subunit
MGLTDEQKRGYERTVIPGFQEDLTLIENVTIDNIEKVLKGRFMNDNIYTAVGPLLFSVNPYR